jgi:peptidoglycan/xylan/chitin deacetylase (PgdA/CDA1 family)
MYLGKIGIIVIIPLIIVALVGIAGATLIFNINNTSASHIVYALSPFLSQQQPLTNPNITTACNCVVFRMDDVQDYFGSNGTTAVMDQFISKNQSLSLGLIMNEIGNDSKIINKVREGQQKGLFELASHGWNHTDSSKLNEKDQKGSLIKANEKMQHLFGKTSDIFIPPFGSFNNATIKAMTSLGLRILSSDNDAEIKFESQNGSQNATSQAIIYHLPSTSTFKEFLGGKWIKHPIANIHSDVDNSIKKYGYAVITLHPQDFIGVDKNGKFNKTLDRNEIKDLSQLIDFILAKNIHITSLQKLTKMNPSFSTFTRIAANTNSSSG